MLRSLILNISKIIVAFAIISVGVMGYLWLENTKETVFVEKVEEYAFACVLHTAARDRHAVVFSH